MEDGSLGRQIHMGNKEFTDQGAAPGLVEAFICLFFLQPMYVSMLPYFAFLRAPSSTRESEHLQGHESRLSVENHLSWYVISWKETNPPVFGGSFLLRHIVCLLENLS